MLDMPSALVMPVLTAVWPPGSPAPLIKPLTGVLSALAQGHWSVLQSASLRVCLSWGQPSPVPSAFLSSRSTCLCWLLSHSRSSPCKSIHFLTASRVSCISATPGGLPLHRASHDIGTEPDLRRHPKLQPHCLKSAATLLGCPRPSAFSVPSPAPGTWLCRCPAWLLAPGAGLTRMGIITLNSVGLFLCLLWKHPSSEKLGPWAHKT